MLAGKNTTTPKKAKAGAAKPPRQKPAQDQRDVFIARYLVHRNASRAYREAGYKDGSSVHQNASALLTSPYVQSRIAEGKAELLRELNVEVKDILALQRDIAFTDRAEITAHIIGACRYCHGIDHRYQWRTEREFSDAMEAYMGKGEAYHANHTAPDAEGGYGYRHKEAPHPDCPECEGEGIAIVRFKDTRLLTDAERNVFAGIEQTQHGLKYRFEDRAKAIESLAEHLQFYRERDETNANAIAVMLDRMRETNSIGRMPLRKDDPSDGGENT